MTKFYRIYKPHNPQSHSRIHKQLYFAQLSKFFAVKLPKTPYFILPKMHFLSTVALLSISLTATALIETVAPGKPSSFYTMTTSTESPSTWVVPATTEVEAALTEINGPWTFTLPSKSFVEKQMTLTRSFTQTNTFLVDKTPAPTPAVWVCEGYLWLCMGVLLED